MILFRDSIYYVPRRQINAMLQRYAQYLEAGAVFIVRMADGDKYQDIVETIESHFAIVDKHVADDPKAVVLVFRPIGSVRLSTGPWLTPHETKSFASAVPQCVLPVVGVLRPAGLPQATGSRAGQFIDDGGPGSGSPDRLEPGRRHRAEFRIAPTEPAPRSVPMPRAADINGAIAACNNGVVSSECRNLQPVGWDHFQRHQQCDAQRRWSRQTILKFTGSDPCGGLQANVCIRGWSGVWSGNVPAGDIRNWTAGYSKGTTQLTLDSTAGLTVGTVIVLDQLNDTVDEGAVVVSDANGPVFSRRRRPRPCESRATAVRPGDGRRRRSRDDISRSVHGELARRVSSRRPGGGATPRSSTASRTSRWITQRPPRPSGVGFQNAYKCWISNVKSLNAKRNHVWLNQAARIEVRDSYFYGTKTAATQSYGVESFTTSDDLVVNNIFERVTTPIMVGPSSGSVFAYNYMIDMPYSISTWMMAGIVGGHDAGTGMNLFEGNVGNQFSMDLYHGTGSVATLYRNRLTGTEPGKTQWGNTTAVNIWAFNRSVNIVGNVLGTPGYHRIYENSPSPLARRGLARAVRLRVGILRAQVSISRLEMIRWS